MVKVKSCSCQMERRMIEMKKSQLLLAFHRIVEGFSLLDMDIFFGFLWIMDQRFGFSKGLDLYKFSRAIVVNRHKETTHCASKAVNFGKMAFFGGNYA